MHTDSGLIRLRVLRGWRRYKVRVQLNCSKCFLDQVSSCTTTRHAYLVVTSHYKPHLHDAAPLGKLMLELRQIYGVHLRSCLATLCWIWWRAKLGLRFALDWERPLVSSSPYCLRTNVALCHFFKNHKIIHHWCSLKKKQFLHFSFNFIKLDSSLYALPQDEACSAFHLISLGSNVSAFLTRHLYDSEWESVYQVLAVQGAVCENYVDYHVFLVLTA